MQKEEQNTQAGNILPGTEEAHGTLTVVTEQDNTRAALQRFDQTFKLEGEVVGAVQRRVSKKGGVRLALLPLNSKEGKPSLKTVSGKTGKELEAYQRLQQDALKVQIYRLMGGMAASNDWTGKEAGLSPDGNVITVKLQRVTPLIVQQKMTEAEAIAFLARAKGVSVAALKEAMGLIAPETPPEQGKPEGESESQTGANEEKANGQVESVE